MSLALCLSLISRHLANNFKGYGDLAYGAAASYNMVRG